MTLVRAGLAEGYYFGEDAALLALDAGGVTIFLAALIQAKQEGASHLEIGRTTYEFFIEGSASDIEFHDNDDTVVWRLGGGKAQESKIAFRFRSGRWDAALTHQRPGCLFPSGIELEPNPEVIQIRLVVVVDEEVTDAVHGGID